MTHQRRTRRQPHKAAPATSSGRGHGTPSPQSHVEGDPRRPWDPPWRSRRPCRELPDPELPGLLLAARQMRGWSLREAAEHSGVSFGMIAHLEHGDRAPSVALAQALAAGYDLPAEVERRLLAVARPYSGRSSPYRDNRCTP